MMADNRTEQPSPRRLERARSEGRFPASREFLSGLVLLLAVWLAHSKASEALGAGIMMFREILNRHDELLTANAVGVLVERICSEYLFWPLAFAVGMCVVTIAVHVSITSFGFAWNKLGPDVNRLNPGSRLSQLPGQNLRSAATAVLLFVLTGYFLWQLLAGNWAAFAQLPRMSLIQGVRSCGEALMGLLWRAAIFFFLWGSVDLFRQRKKWSSELKMTKQEVKEEHKEMEGNPLIRMRIRRLQREAARHRMMQDVPKATAVVVNPTHYAVALRYQMDGMSAPKVVAKGQNWQALRIREIAVRHEVPIVENPPLARALHASSEVGQEIPPHLYQAVAEVLAYIFRLLNGRLPGGSGL